MDSTLSKELQAKWRRKLKASGFNDLEDHKGNLKEMLKPYRYSEEEDIYYRRCGWFLHDFNFRCTVKHKHIKECKKHHQVWALHCEGWGRRRIAIELKSTPAKIRGILKRLHEELLTFYQYDDIEDPTIYWPPAK